MKNANTPEHSVISQQLSDTAAATAKVLLELAQGVRNDASWVQWCFQMESLPVFDSDLIARIRSLTWWAITDGSDSTTSRTDVIHCFRCMMERMKA